MAAAIIVMHTAQLSIGIPILSGIGKPIIVMIVTYIVLGLLGNLPTINTTIRHIMAWAPFEIDFPHLATHPNTAEGFRPSAICLPFTHHPDDRPRRRHLQKSRNQIKHPISRSATKNTLCHMTFWRIGPFLLFSLSRYGMFVAPRRRMARISITCAITPTSSSHEMTKRSKSVPMNCNPKPSTNTPVRI